MLFLSVGCFPLEEKLMFLNINFAAFIQNLIGRDYEYNKNVATNNSHVTIKLNTSHFFIKFAMLNLLCIIMGYIDKLFPNFPLKNSKVSIS